jgi:hypothetical protein
MNMTRKNFLQWSAITTGGLVFGTALPACGGGSSSNSASSASATFTASLAASRVSGVAPLYVNFDATGTTHHQSTNPTHELFYSWTFGDTSAGNWANGVQSAGLTSKNAAFGPVTGHVFETPDTYVVNLIVMDGVNTTTKSVTITVLDPNAVYAGASTICISHSNNFIDAPSGSQQVNTAGNTDMYAAFNTYKASNKRILFCKADSWVASATISAAGLSNMIIGGYGTGVAHTFASGTMVSVTPAVGVTPMFNSSTATDVKFCNFRVAANATMVACQSISADDSQITWYKVEIRGATCAFSITPNLVLNSLFKHEQSCIYECLHDEAYGYAGFNPPQFIGASGVVGTPGVFTATGHQFKRFNTVRLVGTPPLPLATGMNYYISGTNLTANTFSLSTTFGTNTPVAISGTGTCDVIAQSLGGGQGLYVAMTRGGIMGCYFDNCNHGEQTLRMPYTNTSHVNNNYIARPNQTKNVVKIHSRGYENIKDIPGVFGYSEKIVFSANFMDLRGGYSYGDPIPSNGQTATFVGECSIVMGHGSPSEGLNERVRNVIVENNYTQGCLGNPKDNPMFIGIGCPNVTVRNNILDLSMGDRSSAFSTPYQYVNMLFASIATSTSEGTAGVRIYNNTMYSNIYNAEAAQFVLISAAGANPEVDSVNIKNNIWYMPNHVSGKPDAAWAALKLALGATPTNVTVSNNTDNGQTSLVSPNFMVIPPVDPADWRPNTGSYAINTGVTVPVLRDFNMASRTGGTYDMGAVLP